MSLVDKVAVLGRSLTVDDLSMIGEIIFYSETHDPAGAVRQSEITFSVSEPIRVRREVKIFAPPPRYFTSLPKVLNEKIKKKYTKEDVVRLANEWLKDKNYFKMVNGKRKVIYLWERE